MPQQRIDLGLTSLLSAIRRMTMENEREDFFKHLLSEKYHKLSEAALLSDAHVLMYVFIALLIQFIS